ncbi:MAG TPA: hypothetical protein DGW03_19995, partial [Shigella sp.]|nr:hypothetical protein [Shigella sp.]HCV11500.1 hypothetical protein [Shigella sp.]
VELHDKVIGHYLNIKHYQYVGVITKATIIIKFIIRLKMLSCVRGILIC